MYEKKEKPVLRNCEICNDPQIKDIQRRFFNKEMTTTEAAKQLEVPASNFRFHINYHAREEITAFTSESSVELSNLFIDKVGELMDSLDRNKGQIDNVISKLEITGTDDKELLNIYVKLETLLGNQVERLAKLTGELKDANMIKVNKLYVQMNNLQATILENVTDPETKKKIIKVLEKSDEV